MRGLRSHRCDNSMRVRLGKAGVIPALTCNRDRQWAAVSRNARRDARALLPTAMVCGAKP